MKIYEDLTFKPAEDADMKRENANIDADTAMGTMLKYGSEGAKHFYDAYVIPSEMAEAHRNGSMKTGPAAPKPSSWSAERSCAARRIWGKPSAGFPSWLFAGSGCCC